MADKTKPPRQVFVLRRGGIRLEDAEGNSISLRLYAHECRRLATLLNDTAWRLDAQKTSRVGPVAYAE